MKAKQSSKKTKLSGTKHVERVRKACLKLPDTTEKLSHGEPTFFVRKRVFAMCSINHHNDGHIAVVIHIREAWKLIAPEKLRSALD
jgi:hypothetical protein